MISLDEALSTIRKTVSPLNEVTIPTQQAMGCALSQPVRSDVDVPPFDKAMMDGFAIRSADADRRLRVVAQVHAGGDSASEVGPDEAVRIMTGGHVPPGGDAVVMIEKCKEEAAGTERFVNVSGPVQPEQNIQRQASLVRRGSEIAPVGHVVEAEHLGALIEAGAHQVAVVRRPRLAVLATGNELVEPACKPGPNQIRNTNGPMLVGLCRQQQLDVVDLGIAQDDERALAEKIEKGLEADILLLSGGVSAGDLDLVPHVLSQAGVQPVFHKVRVKPGKPIWFGITPTGNAVFGLPGNPVSSLVGFRLFVRAAIERMSGNPANKTRNAELTCDFEHRGDRETLFPSRCERNDDGRLQVQPVAWRGSADLSALIHANCFIRFARADHRYASGEEVPVYAYR